MVGRNDRGWESYYYLKHEFNSEFSELIILGFVTDKRKGIISIQRQGVCSIIIQYVWETHWQNPTLSWLDVVRSSSSNCHPHYFNISHLGSNYHQSLHQIGWGAWKEVHWSQSVQLKFCGLFITWVSIHRPVEETSLGLNIYALTKCSLKIWKRKSLLLIISTCFFVCNN